MTPRFVQSATGKQPNAARQGHMPSPAGGFDQ
jgi:hypothetical protein